MTILNPSVVVFRMPPKLRVYGAALTACAVAGIDTIAVVPSDSVTTPAPVEIGMTVSVLI